MGFCDTGGGYTAIHPATLEKLKLETRVSKLALEGDTLNYLLTKEVYNHPDIPTPWIQSYFKPHIAIPFFAVSDRKEGEMFLKYVPHDVFLGQFFFIQHAWTFDYLTGKVFINTPIPAGTQGKNVQALGFKKDKAGNKLFGHPSMQIEVDGQRLDVLFDTGASFILGEPGKAEFGANTLSTGGSFIAKSVFDEWRQKHPDWRFIAKGEIMGADMIEVPQVKVGNLTAGPVWFSKRPDEAWSKGMIRSMDKVVKGAIGGSFLQYFKVQADYNSELIKFEK